MVGSVMNMETFELLFAYLVFIAFLGILYFIVSDISKSGHPDKKADERYGSDEEKGNV